MTMTIASDSERQRYSQELAAYTLRQWTAARSLLDKRRINAESDQRFMTPAELAQCKQANNLTHNDIEKSRAVKA